MTKESSENKIAVNVLIGQEYEAEENGIMEKRLTEKEVNDFRNGLPGDRKIMKGLLIVFWLPWGLWMLFLFHENFKNLQTDQKADADLLGLFLGFGALAVVVAVCTKIINQRNRGIYQKLKNGEYRLIVSTVLAKDFRYQGSGKSRHLVEFYRCPEIQGEITPISQKQFRRAKAGDTLKVIIIDNLYMIYGILDE